MYIKLVQPKMRKRPMDTDLKLRMSPPLGLYTIANILRGRHRVVVENENIQDITYDDPDIVGITVTVDALQRAGEIAAEFKKNGAVTVAGGIHITTAWETVPRGMFDILCIGAAEGTWERIAADVEKGSYEPVYRCCYELKGENIVSPAYDMIDRSEYLFCNILHTSRGCPYRCDFCYNSSKERQFISRPVDDIIREIEEAGTRHIMFIDDNFIGDPRMTRELLRRMTPMRLKWNAAVSINAAKDTELLDLMRKSGCQSLFIGFESINPESVEGVHKEQNRMIAYEKAVKAIHSRGIMINASFVFGLDSDTPDTFPRTLDWIVKNRIETVTSHILTPYPGTALYDRLVREGRIITHDLSLYNTANVVFTPAKMTPEELYEGYLWIYKEIYSLKNIRRRIPEARRVIAPYLLFNLFYRKYGKFTDRLCRLITYERLGRLGEELSGYID